MLNKFQILSIIILFFVFNTSKAQNIKEIYNIKGKILRASDNEALSFASVIIENYNIYTVCDINGNFSLNKIPKGKYSIHIQCLGYIAYKQNIIVDSNINNITYKLEVNSFAIAQIDIMAEKSKNNSLKISQSAIEYIQPISIKDVLLLLPGSIYTNRNISNFSLNTSRQAGSDANTSLGLGFVSDGAPISNDGMRSQMVGITAYTTNEYRDDKQVKRRSGINKGIDMRYISTDHIESIEFNKGISSAKHGNMSSGMIKINSKKGVSPLRIRLKSDLTNNLAYIGKGYKISDKGGSLHLGVDFLDAINDPREEMDKFTRISLQTYYKNQVLWANKKVDLDMKISESFSLNKMKKDELTYEYNETYKDTYSRTRLLLKAKMLVNSKLIDDIEIINSIDYTYNMISRHKMVLSTIPISAPISKTSGIHEGVYLPGKYYSDFYIENKPLNFSLQLNTSSSSNITNKINNTIKYGLEYNNSKNWGEGSIIENQPLSPFPYDNTYMRPRPNYDIPTRSVASAYLQNNTIIKLKNNNIFKISLGGRISKMLNLPSDYKLHNRIISEPRINISYSGKHNNNKIHNTINFGYGQENKLPTMNHLYPENIYKDFAILNAYSNKKEYRRLITYTNIFDMVNKNIIENKNKKIEFSWDIDYKKALLSFTIFKETSKTGFSYHKKFIPINYKLYSTLKPGIDISERKANKADYIEQDYNAFPMIAKINNSSKTIKKGIEYRLVLPKINSIYTKIEINGAYYKTLYTNTDNKYYYPDKIINNVPYPYVGIYDSGQQKEYKQVNTNIWLNTHIPKLKLIFTNFVQFVWINSKQYNDNKNPFPTEYYTSDGTIKNVGTDMKHKINNNVILRHLKQIKPPLMYALNSDPVSIIWNIKATKEFNRNIKLSFFVDNIIDINPIYTTGQKQTERKWENPFFGIELFINF